MLHLSKDDLKVYALYLLILFAYPPPALKVQPITGNRFFFRFFKFFRRKIVWFLTLKVHPHKKYFVVVVTLKVVTIQV